MNRSQAQRLIKDLTRIQDAISVFIKDLKESMNHEGIPTRSNKSNKTEFTDEELQAQWRNLRATAKEAGNPGQIFQDFVEKRTKADLTAFFRANSLPLSSRESKQKIAKQLLQMVRVESTITGR